tara:strand:+ start:7474 stop:8700 length:1227 start_codon:yes stop_codon:yes gene_type:complete
MTYKEIQNIIKEKFGATRPADIAREFGVTPQVVSNWKKRDQVPYKYVKFLRKKIGKFDNDPGNSLVYDKILNENSKQQQIEIFNIISRSIKLIKTNLLLFFLIPLVFLFSSYIYVKYIKEYNFISQATILPITDNSGMSGIQSLAQQFGVKMPSNKDISGLTSSIMFPEVLKSRMLAKEVLDKSFTTYKFGKNRKLINILMKKPNKKEWTEIEKTIAIDILRSHYSAKVNRNNPLITLKTSTYEAQFSADLGVAIIDVLKSIVDNIAISQIKEKKLFIEARIKDISNQLIKSEEALKDFRMRNRNISSSPTLLLEQERLMRDEEVKTQIFINLKNQYELSRIEEVGGSSMFQVLDFPEAAYSPTGLTPKQIYIYTIAVGFFVSVSFIFAISWYKSNKDFLIDMFSYSD